MGAGIGAAPCAFLICYVGFPMKVKIRTNLLFGFFAIIVSIVLFLLTRAQVRISDYVVEYVNGRFIPYLCAAVMAFVGVMSIISSLVLHKEDEKVIDFDIESKVMLFFVVVIAFAILARYVSFLLASLLFGAFSLFYFKSRSIKKYLIVEIGILLVCIVFRYVLNVKFGGIWGI